MSTRQPAPSVAHMSVISAYGSPAWVICLPVGALLGELAQRGHDIHVHTMSAGVA